jgi:hypothetical protein
MIKTYIRVELSSEGESPKQIIERMRRIGALPVVGDYDFELEVSEDERLFDKLEKIHAALKGSKVRYTLTTRTDMPSAPGERGKVTVTPMIDQKPVELKRNLYKAKLERWREMGLDVSELEPLLEKDLDHFKEASKDFLRTHLDNLAVVKDKHPPENQIDGEILDLMDEDGKTLKEVMSTTGYSENIVTLSLGRLISAGSLRRIQKGDQEQFCLIPPPAPPMRKPLKRLPAEDVDEAEERTLMAIHEKGSTREQIIRATRLPEVQVTEALSSLSRKGDIRVVRKAGKAVFYRS